MKFVTKFLAATVLAAAISGARAEDCTAPCLGYAFSSEIQGDWIFWPNLSSNESFDLQLTVDREVFLALTDQTKLAAAITSEPVKDRLPGEDRIFEDWATYVEKLYGEFEWRPLTMKLGKFEPVQG